MVRVLLVVAQNARHPAVREQALALAASQEVRDRPVEAEVACAVSAATVEETVS